MAAQAKSAFVGGVLADMENNPVALRGARGGTLGAR